MPAMLRTSSSLPLRLTPFGVLAPDATAYLYRLARLFETPYLAKQLVFRRVSFAVHLGVTRQIFARRESLFFPLVRWLQG